MIVSDKSVSSGGVGFLGAFTLLFIGLKLGKVIDWSWWWVLSPSLIPIGLFVAFMSVVLTLAFIKYCLDARDRRNKLRNIRHHK